MFHPIARHSNITLLIVETCNEQYIVLFQTLHLVAISVTRRDGRGPDSSLTAVLQTIETLVFSAGTKSLFTSSLPGDPPLQ